VRRCGWAAIAGAVAVFVMAGPAFGAKPPPADGSAQGACQLVREMAVKAEYGLDPSVTDWSLLTRLLQESRSQGAAKLGKRLFRAPTAAAQDVVRTEVASWCEATLELRCSALECVDGNRVDKIRKRHASS